MIMKEHMTIEEQALKIVRDLIDNQKIDGKDAITLIIAISDSSNPKYSYSPALVDNTLRNSELNSKLKSELEKIDLCKQEIIYGNE